MYVLVSGLPGSGKSTIAVPLAAELELPLLARDTIKETLWDALGGGDLAWSRKLGAASADVFWALARTVQPSILENFFHRAFVHRLEDLGGPYVEVHATCAPELARERYLGRRRHPCHFDHSYGAEMYDHWVRTDAGALALGPVLEVDTTEGFDVAEIATWVRAQPSG